MKFCTIVNFQLFAFLTAVSGLSLANQKLPAVTTDGLQHVGDTKLAVVYVQPGVDFSRYKKLLLADTYVAFKKIWQRKQNSSSVNRVTAADMQKIKAELARLFHDVFAGALEEGGYELVNERDEDVLLIKPAIINLDIIAPGTTTAVNSRTYSESAGEMTLYLELYDSLTDDLIAKTLDRQTDRQTGYFQWQNRVSNRAAANRILQDWARVLTEGLDAARGAGKIP
jgi:hypothetical protein